MNKSVTLQANRSNRRIVSILGVTGSIGQTTLNLIEANPQAFALDTITAENNVEQLAFLARRVKPKHVVIGNPDHYQQLKDMLDNTGIDIAAGRQAIIEAAKRPVDMVVSGIMGIAGLEPVFAAIDAGHTVALATKECLVAAGALLMRTAAEKNVAILPIDSEHNAVFQLLAGQDEKAIRAITLTASGGPFRTYTAEALKTVTPEEAVRHPNWQMGAKISVDSATLMNKGLEMIEAFHLFPVKAEQIQIVIHPQSIVHALVHFQDSSIFAHLSAPDMSVPISYCLGYPERLHSATPLLDLTAIGALVFERPDTIRFPCLQLAYDALEQGRGAPCVLNAANEIAVGAFLDNSLSFNDIPIVISKTLASLDEEAATSLEDALALDGLARTKALEYIRGL
ncbi:MAG: 1-deoxy-D-xylulose-5-phosphate reductoisomerase [Rickettsiales bacterium]